MFNGNCPLVAQQYFENLIITSLITGGREGGFNRGRGLNWAKRFHIPLMFRPKLHPVSDCERNSNYRDSRVKNSNYFFKKHEKCCNCTKSVFPYYFTFPTFFVSFSLLASITISHRLTDRLEPCLFEMQSF